MLIGLWIGDLCGYAWLSVTKVIYIQATIWLGKLLGTSFEKALRNLWAEARRNFGVYQCIGTIEFRCSCGHRFARNYDSTSLFKTISRLFDVDARKGIGVRQYRYTNERQRAFGLRHKKARGLTVTTSFLKLVSNNARYGCLQAAKMSLRASLQSLLEAYFLYIA